MSFPLESAMCFPTILFLFAYWKPQNKSRRAQLKATKMPKNIGNLQESHKSSCQSLKQL